MKQNKVVDKLGKPLMGIEECRKLINDKTTFEELYKIFLQNSKKKDLKLKIKVKRIMSGEYEKDYIHTTTIKMKDVKQNSMDTSFTDFGGLTLYDYCMNEWDYQGDHFRGLTIETHEWKTGKYEARIQYREYGDE